MTTPVRPVRYSPPQPPSTPGEVVSATASAMASSASSTLDATLAPFTNAPPPEQGAAGVVSQYVGGALGVINAPSMFVDQVASAGITTLLNATGLAALFPPMPVAQLGITMHMGTPHVHPHPPSTTPPAPPIPLPSMGVAFLAGSASVLVCGIPALRAGDVGIGLTCGSMAPPFEIVTGASSVYFAGARVARLGIDITMHCNPAPSGGIGAFAKCMGVAGAVAGIAGAAAQASAGNPTAAIVQGLQTGLDAAALALSMLRGKDPAGPPGVGMLVGAPTNVTAGGPPIPNLGAFAQGHLFSALGKLARALKSRIKRKSPPPDANGKRCEGSEPVHLVTGENYATYRDFRSYHGAFEWTRHATSARAHLRGRLGHCFLHVFEARLEVRLHRFTFFGHQGERIEFPRLVAGQKEIAIHGYRLIRHSDRHFEVRERRLGRLEFERDSLVAVEARVCAAHRDSAHATLHYASDGLLTEIRETREDVPHTAAVYSFYYDQHGHLVEVQAVNLVGDSQAGAAAPAYERLVSYAFDHDHLMVAEDARQAQDRYAYDHHHRIVRATDRNSYSYSYSWEYDLEGRCVLASGEDGLWWSKFEYLTEKRQTRMTVHDGGVRTVHYDEDGVITKMVDAQGGVCERLRGEDGRILAEIDAGGRRMDFLYDANGAHTGRANRFGHLYPPELDQAYVGNPFQRDLPRNPRDRGYGDCLDSLLPTMDPIAQLGGLPPQLNSVASALVDQHAEAFDTSAREMRDTYGHVIAKVDAQGKQEEWQYDAAGNVTLHRDKDGRLHQRRIASWNLLDARIDPLGNTVSYGYDPHEYITRIVDPLGTVSEYDYDTKERLIRVRRHGRVREEYVYDIGDRLVEKRGSDGQLLINLTPHKNSLVGMMQFASGGSVELDYDRWGQPTQANTETHQVHQKWAAGRRLLTSICDGRTVEHEYDFSGRSRTFIAGRYEIRYDYDRRDSGWRPTSTTLNILAPSGFKWTLRRGDQGLVCLQHGISPTATREIQQYTREGKLKGRLTWRASPARWDGAQKVRSWSTRYEYTSEGDLVSLSDSMRGERKFEVDAAHRLVAEETDKGVRYNYPLDAAGNLLSKPDLPLVKMGTGNRMLHAGLESFRYDERDHIAERWSSERHVRYEYDSLDQLIAVHDGEEEPWTASYDGLGRRTTAGRGERRTLFWWDDDRLAAETDPDGRLRVYVYVHEKALIPLGFVDYESEAAPPESGRAYSVFSDQVGLPLCIEDEKGGIVWWAARVDPYGRIQVRKDAQVDYRLRWPGHYFDAETGLHYNRFRYYDPILGRYLQSDPIGCAGGTNLYAYPANPLVAVDVLGLHNEDTVPPKEDGDGHPVTEETDADASMKLSKEDAAKLATEAANMRREQVAADIAAGRLAPEDNPACVAAVVDRRTGEVFTDQNSPKGEVANPDDFHPVLRDRIRRQQEEHEAGRGHPSEPGTHAEVKALDQALKARQAQQPDVPLTDADLGEFTQVPQWNQGRPESPHMQPGQPAPCCGNCGPITNGVDNPSGNAPPFEQGPDGKWRRVQ